MQTQCPECQSIFRVTPTQLGAAGGLVRCGQCRAPFDGKLHLRRVLPVTTKSIVKENAADLREGSEPGNRAVDGAIPTERAGATEGTRAAVQPKQPAHQDDHAPPERDGPGTKTPSAPAQPLFSALPSTLLLDDWASSEQSRPWGQSNPAALWWGLGVFLLVMLLAGQYIYFESPPAVRYPLMTNACDLLGCTLPPRRDVARIELASRNVVSHPNIPHALLITAAIKNTAEFAQPWPIVAISLSDLQGTLIARRRFKPAEYLPADRQSSRRIQAGANQTFSLEVADPGENAVAYEFNFLDDPRAK